MRLGERVRAGGGRLLDLAFPRGCVACGRSPAPGFDYLCWDCMAGLTYLAAPFCACCGEPVEGRVDHLFHCHHCAGGARGFDLARSVARHEDALRHAIHVFKYRDGLWLRGDLGRMLAAGWSAHYADERPDAVTWVPLHPARRRRRGYDQAGVLAADLARCLGLPLLRHALARIVETRTQTELTAEQRASNVEDAFLARRGDRLVGRTVVLVDDVMTTGATASACALCLKEAGAARVLVLTLARG